MPIERLMGMSNGLRLGWSSSTRRLGSDCFRCPDKQMHFLRENRRGRSKSLHWAHAFRIALSISLLVGIGAHSPAQSPSSAAPPPVKAEPAAPIDPLGVRIPAAH